MEEPPDPGGSMASLVPPVARYVTITSNNESGMETDGSIASASGRKRARTNKMCRHCNKRRRRRNSMLELKETDCTCDSHSVDLFKVPDETSSETRKPSNQSAPKPLNPSMTNNDQPARAALPPIGRLSYEATDAAPFIVHIQKIQASPDDSTILHPVTFGKFLQKQRFDDIVNGSLKKIGRNRMSLAFTHFNKANEFLRSSSLSKNDLKAFIPTYNITRMGIVRGVPSEWSPEDVIDSIKVPIGCGKILKMRRLNYKTIVDGSPTWKPSQTVVLTFDGQVLPKRIYMCYNALPVELYTYPTIQCYSCVRFGHTKVQCRSKPRCYKCGQAHTADSCTVEEGRAFCCLCSGSHFAISKCCPELDRQKRIKKTMAESCISYAEANKLHPPVSKSFSEVVSSSSQPSLLNKAPSPHAPITTSYKKYVAHRARSPPQQTKGYNHSAHQELIKDYDMPCHNHNGLAYRANPEEQSIVDLIISLINTFSQSTLLKPDHAAFIIETLQKVINTQNGCTKLFDDKH